MGGVVSERFGPGFQEAESRLYRLEYAAVTLAILGFLLWRTYYQGGLDWIQFLFWFLFPDLAAFIPIGVSSKRREWPSWGPHVYNLFHNMLVWILLFVIALAAFRVPYWPLIGWLLHITADRAAGYGLRAKVTASQHENK